MCPPADTNATSGPLDAVADRLDKDRRDGIYVLSRAIAPEIGDLLDAIDAAELAIACPPLPSPAPGQIAIEGSTRLFGVPDVDARATVTLVGDALSVTLQAEFGKDSRLDIGGLAWASVGDLTLHLSAVGPSLDIPVVTGHLSGTIEVSGVEHPITVMVGPSLGGDWLLRATDVPLPDPVGALQALVQPDAQALMPPKLSALGGFEIVELACSFDPDAWKVRTVALTIGAPGKEWDFAPELHGLPKLKDVSLHVEAAFPDEDAQDGWPATAGGNGAVAVTGRAAATITLGTEVDIPVEIARETDQWRVGIVGAHGFPSLGDLVTEVAGKDAAAPLPDVLRTLQMASATLELTIGSDGVRSVLFHTRLADRWPIVTGHLELDGVDMQLFHDLAAGGTSGFFSAVIGIENGLLEIPVAVRRPGPADPITIELGTSAAPRMPGGMSSLPALSGGGDHIAATLPTGLGDVAFVLQRPLAHDRSRGSTEGHGQGQWRGRPARRDVHDRRREAGGRRPVGAARRGAAAGRRRDDRPRQSDELAGRRGRAPRAARAAR